MLVCGIDIKGKFLVPVCGIEIEYLVIMMTVLLLMGTIYTVVGGMLSVLVTDFLQFIVMSMGLIAVTVLILVQDRLGHARAPPLRTRYGAGGFNPLANPDLGWPWVTFFVFLNTAATLTWQTTISRLLSAKDAKTGRQIYTRTSFFFVCRFLIPAVWGIAAMAMLSHDGVCPRLQDSIPLLRCPSSSARSCRWG